MSVIGYAAQSLKKKNIWVNESRTKCNCVLHISYSINRRSHIHNPKYYFC